MKPGTYTNPTPSEHYRRLQHKMRRLNRTSHDGSARNRILRTQDQLEAEFVRAWDFVLDTYKHTLKITALARAFRRIDSTAYDHCTCYYQPASKAHVLVTQPYHTADEVVESLTTQLHPILNLLPQIIPAPEWAFYYPGRATLVIVKFPPGCKCILDAGILRSLGLEAYPP